MDAYQSKLLPIKNVIRDLRLRSVVVSCDDTIEILSAMNGNVSYEKETKVDGEEVIALRGAA
jgi:hypothetical protein